MARSMLVGYQGLKGTLGVITVRKDQGCESGPWTELGKNRAEAEQNESQGSHHLHFLLDFCCCFFFT